MELEKEELPKQDDKLIAKHEMAIKNLDAIQTAVNDERQQCLEDRRFYSIAGAQWEDDLKSFFENRPKIEINKVHLSIMRIISEYRNNRITVDFVSKDGSSAEDLADTCDGLYRSDEQDSNANEAYDNAIEEAIGGGFGAFRLRADYEDEYEEEDERQRICIEPIYDADSCVFFDLNAKKYDKSDAKYAYVLTSMTKEEFKGIYGEVDTSVTKTIDTSHFDWYPNDNIYVAEYFEVEEVAKNFKYYSSPLEDEVEKLSFDEIEENPDLERELLAKGYVLEKVRKVKSKRVHKYIMTGSRVLEDCGYIAGTEIPIIPVYGKRWFVDGVERCMGHVRLAKDSQRLHNLQVSRLAEVAAMSPIEKPIFTPEQIAGHQTTWANDNKSNNPYLLINSITNPDGTETIAGAVGYTKPPQVAPALATLLQFTDTSMKEVLGTDNTMEQISANLSGEAIQKIHDRLDMQTFIYMSNMAKSMKRCGEIWLSMAKDVYVETGRKMKVVTSDKSTSQIELNQPWKSEDGETIYKNDLKKAKFNIATEVTPATSSKKQKTVNNLIQALQVTTDPTLQSVISHLIMMNMEGEGVTDAARFARKKLVQQGVIPPNEKELMELRQEMVNAQNQKPTPEQQYFIAEANKSNASAVKAKADTFKTLAETEKIKMEVAEILSNIDMKERNEILNAIDKIYQSQPQEPQMIQPPQQQISTEQPQGQGQF